MAVKVVTPAWRPDPRGVRDLARLRNAAEDRLVVLRPKLSPGDRHRLAGKVSAQSKASADQIALALARLSDGFNKIGHVLTRQLSPAARRLEAALNSAAEAWYEDAVNSDHAQRKRARFWRKFG